MTDKFDMIAQAASLTVGLVATWVWAWVLALRFFLAVFSTQRGRVLVGGSWLLRVESREKGVGEVGGRSGYELD